MARVSTHLRRMELVAIVCLSLTGLLLRVAFPDRECVEHFDEGIYASALWHDGAFGSPYPARELYAPPLIPWMISAAALTLDIVLPQQRDFAPFIPAIILGTLTIPGIWLLTRSWYGVPAGLFAATLVTFSDFHIIYSRMALTDVPALFWTVLSVYFASTAIQHDSVRRALISGVFCGLAWWTKYTGWLSLAIVISGTMIWWIRTGWRSVSAGRVVLLLGSVVTAAFLVISPWLISLQSLGGYTAVARNHGSYLSSAMEMHSIGDLFRLWTQNLGVQIASQFLQDGVFGSASLGIGLALAGTVRWLAGRRSTGNLTIPVSSQNPSLRTVKNDSDLPAGADQTAGFPPWRLLFRFLLVAAALSVLGLRIWTLLMLLSLCLGGFGGIILWPVIQRAYMRRSTGDLSPTSPDGPRLTVGDLIVAPTIDPALGYSMTACWCLGLLIVTPLYHPYARLFFPLLTVIWIAAAGGVGWWLESNMSVARGIFVRPEEPVSRRWIQRLGQRLVTLLLVVAVVASLYVRDDSGELRQVQASDLFHVAPYTRRTSLKDVSLRLADACVLAARGEWSQYQTPHAQIGTTISPSAVLKSREAALRPPELSADDRQRQRCVIYAYGEPAILYHLSSAGMTVAPVSHLKLGSGDGSDNDLVPAFLIIGPNAKRTPGFWEDWFARSGDFDLVAELACRPSTVTLLDLFSPKWLRQHGEVVEQTIELYRIR